jgi:2-C-methyl-D-erythritol 4-phosphate cytidylyltransferase
MTIWAVLPAAGIGRRMGSTIPKQYLIIDGAPLILHALRRLSAVSEIQKIIVVIHSKDNQWAKLQESIVEEFENRIITVMGGDERYQSVLNGLTAVAEFADKDDWVLVHDAARPCVRTSDIEKLISKVSLHSVGGLLGSAVDNTLKKVRADLTVIETVDREWYWNALTPQMFRFAQLKSSIEAVVASGEQVTDEAAAMEVAGFKPIMIAGSKDTIKITVESDLFLASQILKNQASDNESK